MTLGGDTELLVVLGGEIDRDTAAARQCSSGVSTGVSGFCLPFELHEEVPAAQIFVKMFSSL